MKRPTPLERRRPGTVGASSTPNIVPIDASAKPARRPSTNWEAHHDENLHRTGRHLAADIRCCARGGPQAAKSSPRDRAKCLDCSCYQASEVRLCAAVKCPLWPFRAGKHPWWGAGEKTSQTLTDFEREMASEGYGDAA